MGWGRLFCVAPVDFLRGLGYNERKKRMGRAFGERDYGNFTAGKGQNAVQYLFGRTVLLRFDFGIGGEKPIESRAGCDGKRACGNSIRERKEYGVR